ncbi:MAG: ankyrin repeat domain-containing protein, partial [Janthinobacterium lividum]
MKRKRSSVAAGTQMNSCVNALPLPGTAPASGPGRLTAMLSAAWCASAVLLAVAAAPALAQQGADQINVNGQFIMAARAGHTERAAALLHEGAAVNSRDRNGDSALNLAAAKGNEALAGMLINAGADVNLANLAGVTPLMGAAFSARPALMRQLLAAGASTGSVDRVKKTAAVYAAARNCSECIAVLLDNGVAIDAR